MIKINKPSHQENLIALDASIEKWKGIVRGDQANKIPRKSESGCPLCILGKQYYPYPCNCCILADKTNEPECTNTPFYATSFWQSIMDHKALSPNIADNQMLVLLYELRRDRVIKIAHAIGLGNNLLGEGRMKQKHIDHIMELRQKIKQTHKAWLKIAYREEIKQIQEEAQKNG